MGLDMYLQARKFIRTQYKGTGDEFRALPKEKMDDVFEISHVTADVLYWRKNHCSWLHRRELYRRWRRQLRRDPHGL